MNNECVDLDGGSVVDPMEDDDAAAQARETDEADDASAQDRDARSDDTQAPTDDGSTTSDRSPDHSTDGSASQDTNAGTSDASAESDATADAGPPCYADKDKDGAGAGPAVRCDGYGDGGAGLSLLNTDCDDNNNQRSPSLTDICGDHIDNDCDGTPDDESNNACGGPCTTQLMHQPGEACSNGLLGACARGGMWQCQGTTATICNAPNVAAVAEVCGDAVDNDCDGSADEADAIDAKLWYQDCDGDGYPKNLSARSCSKPSTLTCKDWLTLTPIPGGTLDCDDDRPQYHPQQEFGVPPDSSNFDLNCDGVIEFAPSVSWLSDSYTIANVVCMAAQTCHDCASTACPSGSPFGCDAGYFVNERRCSRSANDTAPFRTTGALDLDRCIGDDSGWFQVQATQLCR